MALFGGGWLCHMMSWIILGLEVGRKVLADTCNFVPNISPPSLLSIHLKSCTHNIAHCSGWGGGVQVYY